MAVAKRVALVCVGHWADEPRIDRYLPFSAGAYRVYAALVSPPLPDCEVRLFDIDHDNAAVVAEQVLQFAPDVVGGSAYVWSLPLLLEVAVQVKFARPYTLVVLGGPSARPAMLDLPHYRVWRDAVDALVVGEGEAAMRALVADADLSAWAQVPGVAVRDGGRWRAPPSGDSVLLDALPSPHQLDLAPRGRSASLETFRGCPLSCAFCEWGVWSEANRVFSQAYLERELQAYQDTGVVGAFLVDAGLNLNRRALHNLMVAEAQVGFFRDHPLATEIYAAHLRDEDFAFLSRVRCGRLGVGLQSNEDSVLQIMQRPHHRGKFERNLARLSDIADCVVELIVGLPGDSFAGLQRSLAYAVALPCVEVHVYHCLALPDGLMTRAPAGSDCDFDPRTLRMRSCVGWPAADLDQARQWLADQATAHGGDVSEDYWSFPGSRPARTVGARPDTGRTYARPLQAGEAAALARAVHAAGWRVVRAVREVSGLIVVTVAGEGGPFTLELAPPGIEAKAWMQVDQWGVAHRGPVAAPALTQLADVAAAVVRGLQGYAYGLRDDLDCVKTIAQMWPQGGSHADRMHLDSGTAVAGGLPACGLNKAPLYNFLRNCRPQVAVVHDHARAGLPAQHRIFVAHGREFNAQLKQSHSLAHALEHPEPRNPAAVLGLGAALSHQGAEAGAAVGVAPLRNGRQ